MRAPAASVLDVLSSDSEYSFLVELINVAGLTDLLQQQDSSPLTFFAPTNQVSHARHRCVLAADPGIAGGV